MVDRGPGVPDRTADAHLRAVPAARRRPARRRRRAGAGRGARADRGDGRHDRDRGHPRRWAHRSCCELPTRARAASLMTFVLVVDDEPAIRRTLCDQPAGARLRGRDGRRRAVGAAGRRRAHARPGPARPRAARPRRRRGARAAAVGFTQVPVIVLSARDRVRRQGRGARPRRRRLRHQAVRDGGAAGPDPRRLAPGGAARSPTLVVEAAGLRLDLADAARHPRRRGDPPDAHRVADGRCPRPPPRPAGRGRPSCCTAVWGPEYDDETNYLRVYMASSVASSRPTRLGRATS